jgi:PTH1 family peptidyl-tRNA hydrolase
MTNEGGKTLLRWFKNKLPVLSGASGEETVTGMKWIVGLGNPGARYAKTRHNIGFMVIDRLSERWGLPVNKTKCRGQVGEGHLFGTKVALFKPMTYMNASGEALRAYMDLYKLEVDQLLVVYDDMDTEFGRIRLRYKGSAGGHNGIKSIIQHLGTQDFRRIRMGISRPPAEMSVVDYVLSDFAKSERDRLPDVIETACDAVEASLTEPFEKVMAKFNAS